MQHNRSELSFDDLKQGLHSFIRESGALRDLKTHLRATVLTEIRSGQQQSKQGKPVPLPLTKTCNAVIAQHLKSLGYTMSYSLFTSEADVTEGDLYFVDQDASLSGSSMSMLENLVKKNSGFASGQLLVVAAEANRHSVGVQVSSGYDKHASLEERLAVADYEMSLRVKTESQSRHEAFEVKMRRLQEEFESQLKRQYADEFKKWQSGELLKVRAEEELKHRTVVQHKVEELAELERSMKHRLQTEQYQIQQLRREVEMKAIELDRNNQSLMQICADKERSVNALHNELMAAREKCRSIEADNYTLKSTVQELESKLQLQEAYGKRRTDDIASINIAHQRELQAQREVLYSMEAKNQRLVEEFAQRAAELEMRAQNDDLRRKQEYNEAVERLKDVLSHKLKADTSVMELLGDVVRTQAISGAVKYVQEKTADIENREKVFRTVVRAATVQQQQQADDQEPRVKTAPEQQRPKAQPAQAELPEPERKPSTVVIKENHTRPKPQQQQQPQPEPSVTVGGISMIDQNVSAIRYDESGPPSARSTASSGDAVEKLQSQSVVAAVVVRSKGSFKNSVDDGETVIIETPAPTPKKTLRQSEEHSVGPSTIGRSEDSKKEEEEARKRKDEEEQQKRAAAALQSERIQIICDQQKAFFDKESKDRQVVVDEEAKSRKASIDALREDFNAQVELVYSLKRHEIVNNENSGRKANETSESSARTEMTTVETKERTFWMDRVKQSQATSKYQPQAFVAADAPMVRSDSDDSSDDILGVKGADNDDDW